MSTKTQRGIPEQLMCPACTAYMFPPIYQCNTGHSVCRRCKEDFSICSICGQKLGSVRNSTLESLVPYVKFPCGFYHNGCCMMMNLTDLEKHMRVCYYRNHYRRQAPVVKTRPVSNRRKPLEAIQEE